jgi:hypothetical protein
LAFLFGFAACLAPAGCGRSNSENVENTSASQAAAAAATAWIKAEPNPVPVPGPTPGSTTITWDTVNGSDAQVYLLDWYKKETLFAGGSKGTQQAPWIVKDGQYVFILYAGTEHQKELARVTVTTTK